MEAAEEAADVADEQDVGQALAEQEMLSIAAMGAAERFEKSAGFADLHHSFHSISSPLASGQRGPA